MPFLPRSPPLAPPGLSLQSRVSKGSFRQSWPGGHFSVTTGVTFRDGRRRESAGPHRQGCDTFSMSDGTKLRHQVGSPGFGLQTWAPFLSLCGKSTPQNCQRAQYGGSENAGGGGLSQAEVISELQTTSKYTPAQPRLRKGSPPTKPRESPRTPAHCFGILSSPLTVKQPGSLSNRVR